MGELKVHVLLSDRNAVPDFASPAGRNRLGYLITTLFLPAGKFLETFDSETRPFFLSNSILPPEIFTV